MKRSDFYKSLLSKAGSKPKNLKEVLAAFSKITQKAYGTNVKTIDMKNGHVVYYDDSYVLCNPSKPVNISVGDILIVRNAINDTIEIMEVDQEFLKEIKLNNYALDVSDFVFTRRILKKLPE